MSLRQMELVWVLALCGIAVAAWCLLRSGPRVVLEGCGAARDTREPT
ncbi:hypothetical protein ACWCYY_31010 [Kitasatospora sp. NPDC001664]